MIQDVLAKLAERIQYFTAMRDREFTDPEGDRNGSWKQRSQYLQGRIEAYEDAIKILGGAVEGAREAKA